MFKKLHSFLVKNWHSALTLFAWTLALLASTQIGFDKTIPQLVVGVLTASLLDLGFLYWKHKKPVFPRSGIITGTFIGMGLSIGVGLEWVAACSIFAISLKHILKYKKRHIFNPANAGLLFGILLLPVTTGWWGLTILPAMIFFGLVMAWVMKKFAMVITYAAVFSIILGASYAMRGIDVVNVFFTLNYFLMFFMLLDPLTSPVRQKGSILFGGIAAAVAAVLMVFAIPYDATVIGLAIANLFRPVLNKIK